MYLLDFWKICTPRREKNIKIFIKEIVYDLDLINLARKDPVAPLFCVGSHESIGLNKKETSLDQLHKLQLVKMDCTPWLARKFR
jgi:hypothetical protein